jgi:hypothetical protein
MINKNLIYNNDILYNKINNYSNILIVDINNVSFDKNVLKEKNIQMENSSYSNFLKKEFDLKFDFIIFYDLFSKNENSIQEILEKGKTILKKTGYIILINTIITNYSRYIYHPFSYLQKYIFGKSVYLNHIDDELKNFGFKIINLTRLYSINLFTFPIEYFCVIIQS